MGEFLRAFRNALRRLVGLWPTEAGNPRHEDITRLASAYRVWCGAMCDAKSGTLDLSRANPDEAVEYLARAALESHISKVCSGTHTHTVPMVLAHIRVVFGPFEADTITTNYASRVRRDFEQRWGAMKSHVQEKPAAVHAN